MQFDTAVGSLVDGILNAVNGIVTPLIGLAGVILGAAAAAILSRRNDTRKAITDIRREVYFEAMDLAVTMYEQLSILSRSAPRGGADPVADNEASEAIGVMMDLQPRFVRSEARVATVGSVTVTEATYEFRRATDDYMTALFE